MQPTIQKLIEVTDPFTGEVLGYTPERHAELTLEAAKIWETAKDALKVAQDAEMKARKYCTAFLLAGEAPTGGTQRASLGNGTEAVFKQPIKYSFVKNQAGKLDKVAIEKALSKIEEEGEVGALIAERIVNWKPELSLTEYKKLTPGHKKIIDKVIVTSQDGAPTLEIVEEK